MTAEDRTPEDLTAQLLEHLDFLRVSAAAFDAGNEAEAKRLAVSIRVLLHDTRASHSVLAQLRIKEKLAYYDSSEGIAAGNLLSTPGLAVLFRTNDSSPGPYYAPLDNLPPQRLNRRRAFDDWWTLPVARESSGATWSRWQFVDMLANKEGGAHVQPRQTETFRRLINDNGLGIDFYDDEGRAVSQPNNFLLVSVRQVAHEVMKTAALPAYVYPRP